MHREPVERMIEILAAVKDENFHIGSYFDSSVGITKASINSCGSTACALGHAALDPWFIDRGLRMQYLGVHNSDVTGIVQSIFELAPEVVENLFAINKDTKEFYKVPVGEVTPAMVINKLKELLNI